MFYTGSIIRCFHQPVEVDQFTDDLTVCGVLKLLSVLGTNGFVQITTLTQPSSLQLMGKLVEGQFSLISLQG